MLRITQSKRDSLSFKNARAPSIVTIGYAEMSGNTTDAAPRETAEVSAKYASCQSSATTIAPMIGTVHFGKRTCSEARL